MLFFSKFLACLVAVNVLADPSISLRDSYCARKGEGIYCDPDDCTIITNCAADGTRTNAICAPVDGVPTMCSKTQKQCVTSNFGNCNNVKKYCKKLPAQPSTTPEFYQNDFDLHEDMFQAFSELENKHEILSTFELDSDFVCPESNGIFAHEIPSSYRICFEGGAYTSKCDPGETFDAEKKTCISGRGTVTGVTPDVTCAVRAVDGVYGVSNNCNVFQLCCGNVAVIRKCPFGLEFDSVDKKCVFPGKATCQ